MGEPTALYRLFDADGELLYVGISGNPSQRLKRHEWLQPWWFQVDSHTLDWKDSRQEAAEAERLAIRAELPRWNREHMPDSLIQREYPERPVVVGPIEMALNRLSDLSDQYEAIRRELFAAIRDAFPETRGEPQVRGLLTKVSMAVGMSREYVAQIRDGKIKP
jgi:predicted GIY-YIG superfamily endonuclease